MTFSKEIKMLRSSHWRGSVIKTSQLKKNWQIYRLYQKETQTQVLSCDIRAIFKNLYIEEHLRTTASEGCRSLMHS